MTRINNILNILGISLDSNYLFNTNSENWKQVIPFRFHKGIKEINPDSFITNDNKIIAYFFDFTEKKNTYIQAIYKSIWNLGGVPVIFIIEEENITVLNGYSFDTNNESYDKLRINNVELDENNIVNYFSYWDLLSGNSLNYIKKTKSSVDEKLLENLTNTKNYLVKNNLDETTSQNIIGRLLFSRYLLDRGVKIDPKYFINKLTFIELIHNKNLLYEYFDYLKETFNGDLFPITSNEKDSLNEKHLTYLAHLFSGDDIQKDCIQTSLFNLYDFKIIPIELISEVYERFMSKSKKRNNGAYYTPSFIADYILTKTVTPFLEENKTCRVLDPSCGSGIFLVETLRKIIENNLTNNDITKTLLINLVKNNIFGIDIDENAVNLTIFSLCLTLMDYIEPKDATKFKFPSLKNQNIFHADFFELDKCFNDKIKNIDFVIGNPPWGSDKNSDSLHRKYIENKSIPISDNQIAQSFVTRIKEFTNDNTKCSLVLPSKPFLYNHNAKNFRKYLLSNITIEELLELSPVRSQLFSGAIAPTFILFFSYSCNNGRQDNIVRYTSIKPNIFLKHLGIIVSEKNDSKNIKQSYFSEYDWLWKIMLYGNTLDFELIKKLKENNKTLFDIMDENNLEYGQGFTKRKGFGKNSSEFFKGKRYLTTKQVFTNYFIDDDQLNYYTDEEPLYRPGFKASPPYVLLKRAFKKKDFSFIATYSENEYVFSNLVTAISGNNKLLLKNIAGIFNSELYKYLLLLQGASSGIEREESFNEERFNFPMILNPLISNCVDEIISIKKKVKKEIFVDNELNMQLQKQIELLNNIIYESLDLSSNELELIDYAVNVTIPLINNDNKVLAPVNTDQLSAYGYIFYNYFKNFWNGNPNYFKVHIYYNEYIVGMMFSVIEREPTSIIDIKYDTPQKIVDMIKLGEEKITDIFFKQKDIRGFNENSFYIIKSNQYKNWHKSIAISDLAEFTEAILNAEKESYS